VCLFTPQPYIWYQIILFGGRGNVCVCVIAQDSTRWCSSSDWTCDV